MNEHVEELFPFYALDVLSAEEKVAVDAYVAANPEAKLRLDEMLKTADFLPDALPPVAPRPEVKAKLMAQVHVDKQRRVAPAAPTTTFGQRFAIFWQRFRLSPALPALAGLALLIAVVALGRASRLSNERTLLLQQTAVLQAEIQAQQAAIANLETEIESQAVQLSEQQITMNALRQQLADQEGTLALLTAPDAQLVQIASLEGEATGQLLYQAGGETAVFLITDLPNLAANQTYQAWFITPEGTFLNAGQIPASPTGDYSTQVTLSQPVQTFAAVGVSVEQKTGSDALAAPTDVVMVGEISVAGET